MKKGFTLAEILITLTVIGVVAAMTLPSIMFNMQERIWDTQRDVLKTRITQAVSQIKNLGDYGSVTVTVDPETGKSSVTADNAAETFVFSEFSKVYKVKNICPYNATRGLKECGIEDVQPSIGALSNSKSDGTIIGTPGTAAGAFQGGTKPVGLETENGESIALYYNPLCGEKMERSNTGWSYNPSMTKSVCLNLFYDLNGDKLPNAYGKDRGFITVFYKRDPVVVAPTPLYNSSGTWVTTNLPLISDNENNARSYCKKNGGRVPNLEDVVSMLSTLRYTGVPTGGWVRTNTMAGSTTSSFITLGETIMPASVTEARSVYCVK